MNETPPDREKRLSRRRLPKSRVKAYLRLGGLDLGPNVGLSLIDLSETGVCMVVKEAVPAGREVTVGLEGQSHARPIVRVGNVVWCKPAEGGAFTVGITFEKRLPYNVYLELTQVAR
jgi:hypothetical protein